MWDSIHLSYDIKNTFKPNVWRKNFKVLSLHYVHNVVMDVIKFPVNL